MDLKKTWLLVSCLRNLCLNQGHKDFLSSGSFTVLSFTFRSMIHFFFFRWCKVCIYWSSIFFLYKSNLLNRLSFSTMLSTLNYLWMFVHICMGLFVDSILFYLLIFVPIQKLMCWNQVVLVLQLYYFSKSIWLF